MDRFRFLLFFFKQKVNHWLQYRFTTFIVFLNINALPWVAFLYSNFPARDLVLTVLLTKLLVLSYLIPLVCRTRRTG